MRWLLHRTIANNGAVSTDSDHSRVDRTGWECARSHTCAAARDDGARSSWRFCCNGSGCNGSVCHSDCHAHNTRSRIYNTSGHANKSKVFFIVSIRGGMVSAGRSEDDLNSQHELDACRACAQTSYESAPGIAKTSTSYVEVACSWGWPRTRCTSSRRVSCGTPTLARHGPSQGSNG